MLRNSKKFLVFALLVNLMVSAATAQPMPTNDRETLIGLTNLSSRMKNVGMSIYFFQSEQGNKLPQSLAALYAMKMKGSDKPYLTKNEIDPYLRYAPSGSKYTLSFTGDWSKLGVPKGFPRYSGDKVEFQPGVFSIADVKLGE